MFIPRKQWGDVLIPCGVHELKCTACQWRIGNRKRYLYIELWKRPEYHHYSKEKVSYGKIKLYHIPSFNETTDERWFDRFTTTLNIHFLERLHDKLQTRPTFLAVVGRVERERESKSSVGNVYMYYWENFIHSVYPKGTDVVLTNDDYLSIYKPFTNKKQSALPDLDIQMSSYEDAPF